MKEEFVIEIVGTQGYFDDDGSIADSDRISINTLGTFVRKGDKWWISYREMDESGEHSGSHLSGLKIDEKSLTMWKTENSTRLILEPGQEHMCAYETPFGPLTLGIIADKLEVNFDENGGECSCKYILINNGSLMSENTVTVKVKPYCPGSGITPPVRKKGKRKQ